MPIGEGSIGLGLVIRDLEKEIFTLVVIVAVPVRCVDPGIGVSKLADVSNRRHSRHAEREVGTDLGPHIVAKIAFGSIRKINIDLAGNSVSNESRADSDHFELLDLDRIDARAGRKDVDFVIDILGENLESVFVDAVLDSSSNARAAVTENLEKLKKGGNGFAGKSFRLVGRPPSAYPGERGYIY